ncbi:MAG: pyridoxal 5'-phosphate synthase glutaminase subunit PdxT [Acidimicrobiales bacterium]|nr:pyridoxal 5'-phosphate synthase glutaminase subunit PdxT [Acidimicrobiales bacterium]MDP6284912.1 pyridoxal 5'-phosphate synthase glutaminase subunit PdxT [Acidimicrobiales bacterium]HJL91486.1 pyridoxal 5'-phosphate synthase glutaminase subunit PdxT [Acidimicrobiales bacterium]HJO41561.1 pyridoxal 5'-phosphate synthase glutaminase subunit PdxT [Acidimicrobiales bacterium]
MKIGVLALQGAFKLHVQALERLGVEALEVRSLQDFDDSEALIIPGGESTTMSFLLESSGMFDSLKERSTDGMSILGTCAGMILLSSKITDGRSDQKSLGLIDIEVRRNGYGRQIDSFESDLLIKGFGDSFRGVFIRAPLVESVGEEVEVLAEINGHPVMCRQGSTIVTSFHPELADDDRIHADFLEMVSNS